jgi:hypothetical protein
MDSSSSGIQNFHETSWLLRHLRAARDLTLVNIRSA